jgi:cysteine desulfurase / selenocysteine lyase
MDFRPAPLLFGPIRQPNALVQCSLTISIPKRNTSYLCCYMYNKVITRRDLLKLGPCCAAGFAMDMQSQSVSGKDRTLAMPGLTSHFPALQQTVNGHPLIYFDTAATAQRPTEVINAITEFYRRENANPAPDLHFLAKRSFDAYEQARTIVAAFINAAHASEIVWTRGTTEAINLVAATWGEANIHRDDEIVLTIAEHASNMLPWQLLAKRKDAKVRYAEILESGHIDLESLKAKLTERTKLVCFSHVSNVLGIINPAAEMCRIAHNAGAKVLIDAAQSAPHIPVDVQQLDCDFLAFSGHKLMGPMGIGVLWARRSILDEMPPYQAGSNMAHGKGLEEWEYSEGARKFGAGTPNVAGPVGLAAAIDLIKSIGYSNMWRHEQELTARFHDCLSLQKGIRILGEPEIRNRISLFSFTLDGVQVGELARRLDQYGIAIRAGDLAAMQLLQRFGVKQAARASLYLYNTAAEIESFARILSSVARQTS